MKSKPIVLIIVALAFGLVAMLGVQQVMSRNQSNEAEVVPVLKAKTDVVSGVELKIDENVYFENFPKAQLPEGAVTSAEQFDKRALRTPAYAGELILQNKLGEIGMIGAAAQIPKGMRLVAVPVNLTTSLSAQIKPGDHVDLMVTITRQRSFGGLMAPVKQTVTILQNIEVHSIDKISESISDEHRKASKVENVQLLVTPEDAQRVPLAIASGSVQLALRNGADDVQTKVGIVDEMSLDGLLSQAQPAPEPPAAEVEPKEQPAPQPVQTPADAARQFAANQPAAVETLKPKRVWKLEIVGSRKGAETDATSQGQKYEIELPDEVPAELPAATSVSPAATDAASGSQQTSSKNNKSPVETLLKAWFGRKTTKSDSKPAQSDKTNQVTAA